MTSERASGSNHSPEATAKDGARRQIKEVEVQEASSPRTVMDAVRSSEVPNQSSTPQDERVKRKPILWNRLRTFVLSPRRAVQGQKELRKRHASDALNLTNNPKELPQSPSNVAPRTNSSFKQRTFTERGTTEIANNSTYTKDGIHCRERDSEAVPFESEVGQMRKACLIEEEHQDPKRLQSNSASIPESTNLHNLGTPSLEHSQALHVSSANGDASSDIGPPHDPSSGREREVDDQSLTSRAATSVQTPPVTGTWGRLTGTVFSASLSKRQSSATDKTVKKAFKSKSSEDVQEDDVPLKRQEHPNMTSFLRPRVRRRGGSSENGKSPLKPVSLKSSGQERAKNKDFTDDEVESPWGVKGQFGSGDSLEKEQGSRSFKVNLNSIASKMNVGRTRKSFSCTDSNDSSCDEPAENGSEQEEEGEKIEMFRDAFVEYSSRSMQSSNNRSLSNRIRTGRRSTLAMFKD